MSWINNDGLYIKYGAEEVAIARGGEYVEAGRDVVIEFAINGSDTRTLTSSLGATSVGILGELGNESGAFGVVIPKGLRITEVMTFVETPFTASAGTVAAGSIVIGLKREDRSTELDHDGLLTSAFTGTVGGLATAGSTNVVRVGSTGAGALVGTTLANDGVVTVSNNTQGTNTYNAGRLIVRVLGYYPYPSA